MGYAARVYTHSHVHCKRVDGVRVQLKLGCVNVVEGACPDEGGGAQQHPTCSSDAGSL